MNKLNEIYSITGLSTTIPSKLKLLFGNNNALIIVYNYIQNSDAIKYPYIGIFIRGIENESEQVRIECISCIIKHCLSYESLFNKVIEILLDLLNDFSYNVEKYSLESLLNIFKNYNISKINIDLSFAFSFLQHKDIELKLLSLELLSFYCVKDKDDLIHLFNDLLLIIDDIDKQLLLKHIYKFGFNNKEMIYDNKEYFYNMIKTPYDIFPTKLVITLLVGSKLLNNDEICDNIKYELGEIEEVYYI